MTSADSRNDIPQHRSERRSSGLAVATEFRARVLSLWIAARRGAAAGARRRKIAVALIVEGNAVNSRGL